MKKFLAVLTASALIVSMPITNVFAEENEVADIVTSSEGTVPLTATVASKYTILLPTTVDVSSNSQTFTIQAKGDVDQAKKIVFSAKEGTHQLQDQADTNNKVTISFAVDKAIQGKDVSATYDSTKAATVTITHDTLTAGYYECELPIVISLENI